MDKSEIKRNGTKYLNKFKSADYLCVSLSIFLRLKIPSSALCFGWEYWDIKILNEYNKKRRKSHSKPLRIRRFMKEVTV